MRSHYLLLLAFVVLNSACDSDKSNHKAVVPSPGFDVHLYFNLFNGTPFYLVYYEDAKIMNWSRLGFEPAGGQEMVFESGNGSAAIGLENGDGGGEFFEGLKFNERTVHLSSKEAPENGYSIDFRAFDGGVAFRYTFDTKEAAKELMVHEMTEFSFYDSDTRWEVQAADDTVQSDAYPLPVELEADIGLSIRLLEEPITRPSMLQFRAPGESNTDFILLHSHMDSEESNNGWPLVTPWKILLISKSNDNE